MEQELWQDGTGNYLKIHGDGPETVADHMFMYQNITGFLPMEIRWIDGEKEYVYDISGKVSLAQYLSESKITKKTLCDLLTGILQLSDLMQEYLLDPDGVVWQEDYIFIDKRTGKTGAIYQENSPFGGMQALGALVEFIMQRINAKDEELAFFVYGLHQRVKDTGMTRQLLLEYMEKEGERVMEKKKPDRVPYIRNRCVEKVQKSLQSQIPFVVSVVLLFIGIGLTLVAWCCGWFREPVSGEYNLPMGIGASVFFLGVTGYGAWRIWPKRQEKNITFHQQERPKKACLISCQGKMPSIPICYYPFVLGTEENRVDGVVSASGIEKIHAQILWEGNDLYVQDEESEKGTFWNGERLVPWQKKRLQDGDILRLAGTEFVVEIS